MSTFADRLRPSRDHLVDVAVVSVLCGLGIVGFDASFGGDEAFTVGLPSVVVGSAVGYVLARLRPPLLVGAAAAGLAFFLLGGIVALREDAIAGVVAGPDVWSGLIDGVINGWVRLLTTVPPAGQAGHLLAIPYFVGFAGGVLAAAAALLLPRWPVALVPATAVLATSVLFGVDRPMSLLLQGALFGAVTIGWLCLRGARSSTVTLAPSVGGRRAASGLALLGVAALGAFLVGPRLPMADATERYVLRDKVEPPFDPSQYPSPLARFREFDGDESIDIDEPLLTVEGLPEGEVIRFAVMDTYDGYVWRATAPSNGPTGTYRRVGDTISGAADGERVTVRFTMGALARNDSVWIPTVGSPTAIRFVGPDRARNEELEKAFRFNRQTETAASPLALREGDVWEVVANLPDQLSGADLDGAATASFDLPPHPDLEGFALGEKAGERLAAWTSKASSPWLQMEGIRDGLRGIGARNHGRPDHPVPGGHSLYRLTSFLEANQPQGNDEQFAAAIAYLARVQGIPSRVALELAPDGDGEVFAEDVRAVVEVAVEGGWVTLADLTPDREPDPQVNQPEEQPRAEVQPPPPTTLPPPTENPEESDLDDTEADVADVETDGSGVGELVGLVLKVLAIPLVLLALPATVVVALKARRRRRRRTTGPPATRTAAAWAELTDLARDLGNPVPPKATRREVARFVGIDGAGKLAGRVDELVFGAAAPDERAAAALWSAADQVRKATLRSLPLHSRVRTVTSLSSLRSVR